ncbi:DedA family protein [Lacrimispora aerotolerans]|jgi:membrane protein DedA with SNARE-associated domain|uniref:DedA family protein n=1 Tax=Lacrimispora aerotolerans TaxID=36832 RepID=UPI00047AEDC1|nr:DedA family protein [Lacrimispora aerotolerans]
MDQFIVQAMNHYGYLAIMVFVVLENIFPFVPSELVLTFAGLMTTQSAMTVPGVILDATILSVVGSLGLYGIGRFISEDRLAALVDTRVGRFLGFKKDDIYKSSEWFQKKGKYSVLFCRCVPVLRCLISLPAGTSKMNLPVFVAFTFIGSLVWNLILVNLGAAAGNNWEAIVHKLGFATSVIGAGVLCVCGAAFLLFLKKRIKEAKVEE